MKEIYGDIFKYLDKCNALCFTSNGMTNNNGDAIMGRGIAYEIKKRYPLAPKILGPKLIVGGNHVYTIGMLSERTSLVSFPTKYNWRDKSSLELIKRSAQELKELVDKNNWSTVCLPKPGCSNGGLQWSEVKEILEPILDNRFYIVDLK